MRRKGFIAFGLAMGISLSMPLLSYADPTQSARWVGSGDHWQVSDNNGGFIKDCWFEDDVTHHWYMIGAEDGTVMYSGLVTDQSTGKSYLLNVSHDGTFGRMLTVDGVYHMNGVDVYMTFHQEHDGAYGAITSGLTEVRNVGVNELQLDRIPTDNNNRAEQEPNNMPPENENRSTEKVRASDGTIILNIANHTGQRNIAESGSFQAEDNQTLVLNIISDIKGGTVDLFLFDPNYKEQRITIGSYNITKEIPLEKGKWQYNCSGMFQDGGDIRIVGTIK